jgi:hypothetical protein
MKFFTGCVAAATLALAATAAQAQVPARGAMIAVSDFDGPYAPSEAAPPPPARYGYGHGYQERGPAPMLLPPTEVYAVLRENGFSPLGIPRLRGGVYTVAVIDRGGEDGRLVIDARDGRILRFMPAADAYGMALGAEQPAVAPYRPQSALPPPTMVRSGPPRPPGVPAKPAEPATPQAQVPQAQPVTQTAAAVPSKPAEVAPQAAAPTVGQVKPAATILPTQEMPAAQGLD